MAITLNSEFAGNVKISKVAVNGWNHTHVEQARIIAKSLGIVVAARYLKKRGWSVEAASYYLVGAGKSKY